MKKNAFYAITSAAILIVAAILWLLGYLIEGFNFNWVCFLDVLFLGEAVLNFIEGFRLSNVARIILAGVFLFCGALTMFITFELAKGIVPYIVIFIVSAAITSVLATIVRKGKKWDNGDND